MRAFTFRNLPPLKDFQFLTDSSGYVLTQQGQLYRFSGEHTTLLATPAAFQVSHFHFRTQTQGAIVGVAQATEPTLRQGAVGATGGLPLLLLLWLFWSGRGQRLGQRLVVGLAGLLLASSALLSCAGWQHYRTPDPASPHATLLTHSPLTHLSFHTYVGNKGQQSFIALTNDQGRSWDTHPLPTNFFPTALATLGRNFLVGTYARQEAGTIPLHGDGDLWIYGSDSTHTPQLAINSPQHPYAIDLNRGVTGLLVSALDSALFVFGSDRMPTFPNDVMSATPGNIFVLPGNLQPPTRLIDTPDTVDIHSLSQARTGELWVTMAGRRPQLRNRNLVYAELPAKRLLRFRGGQWQPVTVPSFTSFEQVAFVPGTATGYVLAETGQVLETRSNGDTWHPLASQAVRRLHPCRHGIAWLQGENQLVFYPTPNQP